MVRLVCTWELLSRPYWEQNSVQKGSLGVLAPMLRHRDGVELETFKSASLTLTHTQRGKDVLSTAATKYKCDVSQDQNVFDTTWAESDDRGDAIAMPQWRC